MRNTVLKAVSHLRGRGDGWFATFTTQDGGTFQVLFNSDGSWMLNLIPISARFEDVREWARRSHVTVADDNGRWLLLSTARLDAERLTDLFVGFLSWYGAANVTCIETGCAAAAGTTSQPRARSIGLITMAAVTPLVLWLFFYGAARNARRTPAIIAIPALALGLSPERLILYGGGVVAALATCLILWRVLHDHRG